MKSTLAAKYATQKRILAFPHSIFLLYEISEVDRVEQIAARQRAASDWVKRGYISPNEVDDVRAIGQAMNLFVWDAGKADQRKCDKVCHARVRSSMSTV